jgi:hypothetical protein
MVPRVTALPSTFPPGHNTIRDKTNVVLSGCGSQADTAIIRDREIASGKAGPLGRTQGNGPVDAAVMVAAFMGTNATAAPPTNKGASGSVGVEDNIPKNAQAARKRQFLDKLLGGLGGGDAAAGKAGGAAGGVGKAGGAGAGIAGLFGGGGEKAETGPETGVAEAAGKGATQGMPTAGEDGSIKMTFRQVWLPSFHLPPIIYPTLQYSPD